MTKPNDIIKIYPIVITRTGKQNWPYRVDVPEFGGILFAKTIADCFVRAKKYVGNQTRKMKDENIPDSNVRAPKVKDGVSTLLEVDISKYRRHYNERLVHKTVTVPSNLNELGKARHINFSRVLTKALRKVLC